MADAPTGAQVFSVTRTPDEISVVCAEADEPPGSRVENGWRILRVAGPIAFDVVGVVASVAVPLAEAEITVFVVSTYDTDLVLVRDSDVDRATGALGGAGHPVTVAPG
ncbi:MAG: ACT domain-containing protein [Acidimicrobiales bacterium]